MRVTHRNKPSARHRGHNVMRPLGFCAVTVLAVGLGVALAALPARAERVPAHLAGLAGQVYDASGDTLKAARKAASPEKQAIFDKAMNAFKRAQVGSWGGKPVDLSKPVAEVARLMKLTPGDETTFDIISELTKVTGDPLIEMVKSHMGEDASRDAVLAAAAAVEQLKAAGGLETGHEIALEDGDMVRIDWSPQTAELVLQALRESDGDDAYEFSLPGKTEVVRDAETGAPTLMAAPDESAVPRAFTAREIRDRIASIFGLWENEEFRMKITGGSADDGRVRRSPAMIEADMTRVREELDELGSAKEFVWEHPETAEIIRQERFRRLDEPWEYKGERQIVPDGDARKVALERELKTLEDEMTGKNLPTSERLDPVAFNAVKASGQARRLTVDFTEKDGPCSYVFTDAYFDGRRVVARGTHKEPCSMNKSLPPAISNELIANWSPPRWLLLRASYDADGALALDGALWGMYVAYDPTSMSVNRIFDPHASDALSFRDGGGGELVALGAAETAWP